LTSALKPIYERLVGNAITDVEIHRAPIHVGRAFGPTHKRIVDHWTVRHMHIEWTIIDTANGSNWPREELQEVVTNLLRQAIASVCQPVISGEPQSVFDREVGR
jgi:hypothetical protein